jgi:hypothetical protein
MAGATWLVQGGHATEVKCPTMSFHVLSPDIKQKSTMRK